MDKKKISDETYNKLKEDNKIKPKWNNNTIIIIKETINNYIQSIFNGKQFKNETNLRRMDFIYKAIPKELIKNQEISKDKINEINNVIQNEVNNAVILFNKKRKELPLFENFLGAHKKILIKITEDKIKELMSNIHYSEDKIPYNSDNFYGFLKKNEKIILNSNKNHQSFNYLINEISQNKSYEYNNILIPKQPSWNKIKNNIKIKIESECDEFCTKFY